jgi:hypothetical protein
VFTNHWFRSGLMDMLLTCLGEEAIELLSPYLVQELISLERSPGEAKISAAPGAKDDRVMALGIPLFCMHMDKPPAKQFRRRRVDYTADVVHDPAPPYPVWLPPLQAQADLRVRPALPLIDERRHGRLGAYVNPHIPERYTRGTDGRD